MNSETGKEVDNRHVLTRPTTGKKQLLRKGSCGGWSIECYKRFRPDYSNEDISRIEFSAHAETEDLSKCSTPNLCDSTRTIRVDFDNKSVVVLLSSNFANLIKKLQSIFSGIRWEKEKP
jgi:hypothetical protein